MTDAAQSTGGAATAAEDPRGPLYLTAAEASDWFRTHGEDIGRPIILVEDPRVPCPPEHVAAWDGYGRWETGLTGGRWPTKTLFSAEFLANPPHYAGVMWGEDDSAQVGLIGAAGAAIYFLEGRQGVDPLVQKLLDDMASSNRAAYRSAVLDFGGAP